MQAQQKRKINFFHLIFNKSAMALPAVLAIVFVLLFIGSAFFLMVSQRRHETVLNHSQHQADLICEAAEEMTELLLRKAFESFDPTARMQDNPLNRLYYSLLTPLKTGADGEMNVSSLNEVELSPEDLKLDSFIDSLPGKTQLKVTAQLIRARAFMPDAPWEIPDINAPSPNISKEMQSFFESGKLPLLDMHLPTINLAGLLTFGEPPIGPIKLGNLLGLAKINITEEFIALILGQSRADLFPLKLGLSYKPPLPHIGSYAWPSWNSATIPTDSVQTDSFIEKAGLIKIVVDVEYSPKNDDSSKIKRKMTAEKEFRLPDLHSVAPMYSLFIVNSEDKKINLNEGGNLYINSWPIKALWDNLTSFMDGQLSPDSQLPGSIRYNGTQPTVVFPSLFAYQYNAGNTEVDFDIDCMKGCELLIAMHPNWLPSAKGFVPKEYSLSPTGLKNLFSLIRGIVTAIIPVFQGDSFNPYNFLIHDTQNIWLTFRMPYVRPRSMGDLIYEFLDGQGFLLEAIGTEVASFFENISKFGQIPGEDEWKYVLYGIPSLSMNKATTHLFGNFALSPPLNRACEGLVEKRAFNYFNTLGYFKIPAPPYFFPLFLSFSHLNQGKFTYPSSSAAPHWSKITQSDWDKMLLAANNDPMITHNPTDRLNWPRNLYHHSQYVKKSGDIINNQQEFDKWLMDNTDSQEVVVFDRWLSISDDSGQIVIDGFKYRGNGGIYSDVNLVIRGDIKRADPKEGRLTLISWHDSAGAIVHDTINDIIVDASVVAKNGLFNTVSNFTINGNLVVDTITKVDAANGTEKMGGCVSVDFNSPSLRSSVYSLKKVEGKYDPGRYGINFAPGFKSLVFSTTM